LDQTTVLTTNSYTDRQFWSKWIKDNPGVNSPTGAGVAIGRGNPRYTGTGNQKIMLPMCYEDKVLRSEMIEYLDNDKYE